MPQVLEVYVIILIQILKKLSSVIIFVNKYPVVPAKNTVLRVFSKQVNMWVLCKEGLQLNLLIQMLKIKKFPFRMIQIIILPEQPKEIKLIL